MPTIKMPRPWQGERRVLTESEEIRLVECFFLCGLTEELGVNFQLHGREQGAVTVTSAIGAASL